MIGCSIDGLKHPHLHLQLTLRIMPSELKTRLQAVDAEKAKLDRQRPLPPNTVSSLREKLMLEWTYHSNAIEGNTLTLRETKVVLEGITVGGKSLREHLEATNHRDAIVYVEDIVAKQEGLSEWQIKNIHSLIMKGIDQEEAGRYRRENVVISGASMTPPDFLHIDREMQQLIQWHERSARMHVIERAAELHARFVKIHPFVDGNGRTGRLLMNFELMKEGTRRRSSARRTGWPITTRSTKLASPAITVPSPAWSRTQCCGRWRFTMVCYRRKWLERWPSNGRPCPASASAPAVSLLCRLRKSSRMQVTASMSYGTGTNFLPKILT